MFIRDIINVLRCDNWIKNLLVFSGIFFGGTIISGFFDALLIFIAFCFASSIIYLFNDIWDIESDKHHPTKKNRPIASGRIRTNHIITLFIMLSIALFISLFLITTLAIIIIGIYIIMNIWYNIQLKHLPVIGVLTIVLGLLLRVLAGTLGLNIDVSFWLILTVGSLALFLATAKRHNEIKSSSALHKKVLAHYSIEYLNMTLMLSASMGVVFYSLYAVEQGAWLLVASILFVIAAFMRYWYLIMSSTDGRDPISVIIKDYQLVLFAMIWIILNFVVLYTNVSGIVL